MQACSPEAAGGHRISRCCSASCKHEPDTATSTACQFKAKPCRDYVQPPPGWDLAWSAAELWRLLCPLWAPCPPSQPCQVSDPGAWPSSWVQELCHQPLALHLGWRLPAAQARQTWQSRCRSASQPAWTPLHTNNKVCNLWVHSHGHWVPDWLCGIGKQPVSNPRARCCAFVHMQLCLHPSRCANSMMGELRHKAVQM